MSHTTPSGKSRANGHEKGDKVSKEAWKAASRHAASGGTVGGIPASAYNPISGTFHSLDPGAPEAQAHAPNGRYRSFEDGDDVHNERHESDTVSNNGSCSGESEDHPGGKGHSAGGKASEGGTAHEKREKMRAKNEKKHQRQKERRAQELKEKCTQFLTARKLEHLASQLVAMGFSKDRSTMALICNDGNMERSVSWLLEGGESSIREGWNAHGSLKLDISEELARLAELEIRYGYARVDVERAVVQSEGDMDKASASLRERFPNGVAPPQDKSPTLSPTVTPLLGTGVSPGTSPGAHSRLLETGVNLAQGQPPSSYGGNSMRQQAGPQQQGVRSNGAPSQHDREAAPGASQQPQYQRWQVPQAYPAQGAQPQRYIGTAPAEAPAAGGRPPYLQQQQQQQQVGVQDGQRPNSADSRVPGQVAAQPGAPAYRLPPTQPPQQQQFPQPSRQPPNAGIQELSQPLQQPQQLLQRFPQPQAPPHTPPRMQGLPPGASAPPPRVMPLPQQQQQHYGLQPPPVQQHPLHAQMPPPPSMGASSGWSNGMLGNALAQQSNNSMYAATGSGAGVIDPIWKQGPAAAAKSAPLKIAKAAPRPGVNGGQQQQQQRQQHGLQVPPQSSPPLHIPQQQPQSHEHVAYLQQQQQQQQQHEAQQLLPGFGRSVSMPGPVSGWGSDLVQQQQPQQQAPALSSSTSASLARSPAATSPHTSLLSANAGLLSGWGSAMTGSSVDWSMGPRSVAPSLHSVDWSVDNGPATGLWGLTAGLSSLGVSGGAASAAAVGASSSELRSVAPGAPVGPSASTSEQGGYNLWNSSNGVLDSTWLSPVRGRGDAGEAAATSAAAAVNPAPNSAPAPQEWTSPFAGKDLFQLPHSSVPSQQTL